ncbi:hypothetical protein EJB05_43890, partial [Eragrostis curvula]
MEGECSRTSKHAPAAPDKGVFPQRHFVKHLRGIAALAVGGPGGWWGVIPCSFNLSRPVRRASGARFLGECRTACSGEVQSGSQLLSPETADMHYL